MHAQSEPGSLVPRAVEQAERRYAALAASQSASPSKADADEKIEKQKREFESLMKQYNLEQRVEENRRKQGAKRAERIARRDAKIAEIKQRRLEEQLAAQQKQQAVRRNAHQAKMQKEVMKLAHHLERGKALDEKRRHKEGEERKIKQKKQMVETIENYFKDKISMLKDKIDNEKFDRKIAEDAQKQAMLHVRRELDAEKRKEVQRYIQLLKQDDERFNMDSNDLGRLEREVVKMYKKK